MEEIKMLYKYMSFHKFVEMIEMSRQYLTNITLWDDPYEGYTIKKHFGDGIPEFALEMMGEHLKNAMQRNELKSLYAQSWTYDKEESDAMWRIYSQDELGVRIAVNLDDILPLIKKSISREYGEDIEISHYKVKYGQRFDITSYQSSEDKETIINDKAICEFKRNAFKHEKEYRISYAMQLSTTAFINKQDYSLHEIANELDNINYPKVIYYNIPLDTIKEVILDPRASYSHEQTFLNYCSNRQFEKNRIIFRKSDLYTI